MRRARVFLRNIEAGILTENDNGSYTFEYDDVYSNKCMI